MNHRIFYSLFMLCVLLLPGVLQAELVDRIVAEVNGEVITLSELNEYGRPYFQKIIAAVPADSVDKEIQRTRQELLEQLIDDLLIQQKAMQLDVMVQESDIDEYIAQLIDENKITHKQFITELSRVGTTEEQYRKSIKKQMLKSRMVNIEVRSRLVITDEKIQEYYDNYYQKTTDTPSGYHILQLGLGWNDNSHASSKDEALQKMREIKKRLIKGGEFRSLAQQFSELPSAEDGGDIGTFATKEMAPYMLEAVAQMNPGEISSIIETPTGFQILKLLSKNIDGILTRAPLEKVKEEIKETLYKQELEKQYTTWLASIRKEAFIKNNL